MKPLPSVLVVEDEPGIAELIMVNLRHNGFRSQWAASSQAAQAMLDAQLPDAIVLDWMLPGESGLVLAKRWRAAARSKSVPILMLTARGDEADRIAGLDAGADDYIAKPFSPRELVARIRAVLRRRAPEELAPVLKWGDLVLDVQGFELRCDGRVCKLGPIEFKLLASLMAQPTRVHTRRHLLEKVWGGDTMVEERTVDVHVKRLRAGLGEAAFWIETVRGLGYRMAEPIESAGA